MSMTQAPRVFQEDKHIQSGQKWKLPPNGQPLSLFSGGHPSNRKTMIRPDDDGKAFNWIRSSMNEVVVRPGSNGSTIVFHFYFPVIFRVYCSDHTYCTLRFSMNATAEIIKACAADKLQINRAPEDLSLVEIKSNGEKTVFKDHDVSIPTALCLNGRIFVSPKDQVDTLVCSFPHCYCPFVLSSSLSLRSLYMWVVACVRHYSVLVLLHTSRKYPFIYWMVKA